MQDMTCPQCKENVQLDKFIGNLCAECVRKTIEKSKKPKPTKN